MKAMRTNRVRPTGPAWLLGLWVLCLLVGVAACDLNLGAQEVTGAEREAVLAYSEPKTDNLMAGFNAGDYALFARDFEPKMREALTESLFQTGTRPLVYDKIGAYVSRQVASLEKQDPYVAVIYTARFEKEDGVTMRVVFEIAGDHRIGGLWFDSPKLRQQ